MPKCLAENSTCVCSGSNVQVAIDRLLPCSVGTGNLPPRAYFLQVPAVIRERRYTGGVTRRLEEHARECDERLTESGRAIGPGLLRLGEWAERYMAPPAKRRTKA